ncbi:MAG: hypothetical protein AAF500_15640 [Myxococcota bacterium]
MPRSPSFARDRLGYGLAFLIVIAACGGESGTRGDPGAGGNSTGGGGEGSAEYFLLTRVNQPSGRAMYASILPGLDHGPVDLGEALELSGFSRVRAFNGKLYAFDAESGAATRYTVSDDQRFAIDEIEDGSPARLGFSNFGIKSFSNAFLFVNETQAFYFDTFSTDLVIEFNPTAMTLTGSFPGGLVRTGYDQTNIGARFLMIDQYAVVPISWTDTSTADYVATQAIAILDLRDPTSVQIIEDDRCVGTSSVFLDDGYVYAVGTNFGTLGASFAEQGQLPSPCVLRWEPGSDAFDPGYIFDIGAEADLEFLTGATSRGDGTLVTKLYVGDRPPSEVGVFELMQGSYWQLAVIDLVTGETEIASDFPPSSSNTTTLVIDGEYLVADTVRNEPTRIYRLDDRDAGELFSVAGDVFRFERFR